jgi:uridine kinase
MSHPFIIGISGGSGSGKSTVTRRVIEAAGRADTAVLVQDNYYRDQSALTFEQRLLTNYDHPRAFDWDLMMLHINDLHNGLPIQMPEYDFSQHTRSNQTTTVAPAKIIVIEGLFALYEEAMRDIMSLKIFVDTAADVRFIRRLQRDVSERGRTVDNVIEHYLSTVRPMHRQFIEPSKRFADIILPHGANEPAVDMITTKVSSVLTQKINTQTQA